MSKQLSIGLFGFGVVGEGLYKVLQQTPALNASIKKVVIKHPEKKRSAPLGLFTTDAEEVLNDPSINVVVELVDDADAAWHIISTALKNGKHVVSANKKCIAANLEEFLSLQHHTGNTLLYEAAVCASIPVIRNLEEYYDNDLLQSVSGIINGSTNYILGKMLNEGSSFKEALLQAQQLGFAESDPSLDVNGIDALNKLTILLLHSYGIVTGPSTLLHTGIQHITASDAGIAREKGCRVKLVAHAVKLQNERVNAFLLPQFVTNRSLLYNVPDEYNGVVIKSGLADEQFFYGKGAGGFPTASAVLSDLSALRYQYKYEYKKRSRQVPPILTSNVYLKVYVSFDKAGQLPKDEFEWIEEWHSGQERSYIVGVIHQKKLLDNDWWKQPGVSLILTPEPIIENLELRKVKKRSLELAGII
jgi:homoserine dehydrogenase